MNGVIPEDARFEVKFVAEATRYHDLERWILLNTAGFKTTYPPRRVNNVYFDTPDLFSYAENLSGTSDRAKVRLRWYGGSTTPESTVLEVKRRRNHLGWKHHFDGGPADFRADSWIALRRQLGSHLAPEGKIWLDAHPTPVLINRYDRQYFETPEGKLRATLDRHQAVFDQRVQSRPNLRQRANLPDTVVVEIKFRRSDHRFAAPVIEGLPVRVSRNSKYVIGVRAILQPLGG
ncbi:MAG: VTC domain-containing protein [Myxococcota bacterium]